GDRGCSSADGYQPQRGLQPGRRHPWRRWRRWRQLIAEVDSVDFAMHGGCITVHPESTGSWRVVRLGSAVPLQMKSLTLLTGVAGSSAIEHALRGMVLAVASAGSAVLTGSEFGRFYGTVCNAVSAVAG